jgi:tetratricopeptide (TPR) repeat protein
LALNPDYADAHSNFSATLHELARFDEAAEHARRAIALNPRLADAYANAALVENTKGRKEEALRLIDTALSFAPGNIRLLLSRAQQLQDMDRLDEALALCERVLVLQPADGDGHHRKALVLRAAGRYGEALDAFDRAIVLLQRPGAAIGHKAVTQMEMGRAKAEFMATFDAALAADDGIASIWLNRADAKTFTAGDPDIAAMETLLASGRVQGQSDQSCLHFALGKAYFDVQEPEAAFRHLAEGNQMKRRTISYDADATAAWLARIADAFPAERMRRLADAGMQGEQPVFVIGMPRSGTTLVEQVLASHPQVHGAGELPVMQKLVSKVYGPGRVVRPYPEFVPMLKASHLREFGRQYLAEVSVLAPGMARIVDKMPANFLYAGLLHLMLPQARIIHCRRDAVDTCLSCYSKLFASEQNFSYDLAELGHFHRGYTSLTEHWRKVIAPTHFIEVDYADMVNDLEGQARRLIAFLGLPWDDACLEFHRSRRPVKTASVNQVRQPVYKSSLNRAASYRPYLAPLIQALGMG